MENSGSKPDKLHNNKKHGQQPPRLVPLWNLDALRRCVIECHDDGVSMWIDDPASIGIGE